MKKYLKENWFRLVATSIIFLFHSLVYWIIPAILKIPTKPAPDWMITIFDNVPVVPFFMVFYFGCFVWWLVTFLTANKKRVYDIAWVAIFGYIVISICFIIFPYTMIRTEDQIVGNDIFSNLMRFMRIIDEPGKIFPSVHVFVSALAYLSVAFDKEKKLWVRIFNFTFMIMVWVSTLFLKQHYFIDGLVGIFLAIIILLIVKKTKLTNWLINLEDSLKQKLEEKHNK